MEAGDMQETIKRIFVIGGLSESGKSSVGKYLDSKGIPRLKIVEFLKGIMRREEPGADFDQWQPRTIETRSEWLWREFVKDLKSRMQKEKMKYCALESIYRPGLAQALRDSFGERLIIVYVDIPQQVRLQRQVIRLNLKTIEEAREYLIPRDEDKIRWGVLQIKEMADVIIDNSGALTDLYQQVDKMIEQFCYE